MKRVLFFAWLVLASACTVPRMGGSGALEAERLPSPEALLPGTPLAPSATDDGLPRAPVGTTADGAAIVMALQEPRVSEAFSSPDGLWRAEFVTYDCVDVDSEQTLAYQELRLVDANDGTSRLADSQLQSCGGLGAAGLAGRFWSENSRYFYYSNAAVGAPDGCGFWMPPYLRLDTFDFRVEVLGEGPISPDGTMLAAWLGNRLGVWQISGDTLGTHKIYAGATVPGPIAWRPDSSAIAFLISEGSCPLGETDLGRLDLSNMLPIILLRNRDPSFADLVWDVPNRVTLTDEKGGVWRYNFLSRDLWQIAPSPNVGSPPTDSTATPARGETPAATP
ncbi:MAG TPA: hypothetical protein VJ160_05650 [Anaerolineales bacterium]|nr:hypothetical protein [Anaerolineales bacterium]